MSHQDGSDVGGPPVAGHPTGERQDTEPNGDQRAEPAAASTTAPAAATTTAPPPAVSADRDPVTYEAGWDSTVGMDAALLTAMVYVWWLLIGGTLQMLVGGMYLGSLQGAQLHLSTSWANLIYVALGVVMVIIGFGILRLERWAYWGGWVVTLGLLAVCLWELVRWVTGTPISLESGFFIVLDVLFFLYNIYFLLMPATRKLAHFPIFRGSSFAPGVALCGVALATPALAATLFVNHIDSHLSEPVLLTVYLLASVLVIVMAFMAVRGRKWVWWADLAWDAALLVLSGYFIAHQIIDVIPNHKSVDTQGFIFCGLNFIFTLVVVVLLFTEDVRQAVFGPGRKRALFSPPMLAGGLSLAVFALVIYLLPGDLGKPAISYTVIGLAMGTVVGLLPGADPTNRISAYLAGLLLAFASYVVRGGLLPYTKGSSAVVVLVMLVVVTMITAVVRSRAWFVLLLLGVGTMYGLVEPGFQAAPSGYLALAGLPFVGSLLGFGLGYAVSSLLGLELVPYEPQTAVAAQATAASSPPSNTPALGSRQAKADAA